MTQKGAFISFEGADGCGKSTIAKEVVKILQERGIKAVATREPGGTPLAEKIREVIIHNEMDAIPEALLFFAARYDHYFNHIKPLVESGHVVVSDRFVHSSLVYQGLKRNIFNEICILDKEFMGRARPDLTLIIDTPSDIAIARMKDRGVMDRFDAMSVSDREEIRMHFANFAAGSPRCRLMKNVSTLDTCVQECLFHIDRTLEKLNETDA